MAADNNLTLQEIHEGTIKILEKIISICDELEINYFVAYGTLLGAVRHQGFIPWDDDCDITMIRPEFDEFVAYCAAHEKELLPFRLMTRKNTKGYPYTIPRFCDLSYGMTSEHTPDVGMGMFVDVYPLDGVDRSFALNRKKKQSRLNFYKKFLMSGLIFSQQKEYTASSKSFLRTLVGYPFYQYAHFKRADYFLSKLERLADLYPFDSCDYVGLNVWDAGFYVLEKWHYENFEYLPFEGLMVKAPAGYDEVLRQCYGNYMLLPPEESRRPHHDYTLYRKT